MDARKMLAELKVYERRELHLIDRSGYGTRDVIIGRANEDGYFALCHEYDDNQCNYHCCGGFDRVLTALESYIKNGVTRV